MKRLALLVLFAAGGCAGLEKLDVSAMTGGRFNNQDAAKLGKAANAVRRSAEEISESEEYYIGRAVSAQILARYKPLNDAALNLYLQKVAQAVAAASDRPATFKGYHVQVLDSAEPNAFAAPGGFLFVTKGLLQQVKSEDELAAVLGHEIAHVAKKHGLKTIRAARLTSAFALLGSEAAKKYTPEQISQLTSAFEGAIDDVVSKLVVDGYSRDKEYEADSHGARYARAAFYDPAGLKAFLSRLDKSADKGGLFKTHPSAASRLSALPSLGAAPGHRASSERTRRFTAALRR